MKERPILFSAPMVRAILAGRKTQTRRIVKPQPSVIHRLYRDASILTNLLFRRKDQTIRSPYGTIGDRLWVRETWAIHQCADSESERVHYRADCATGAEPCCPYDGERIKKWRPSIFMPRWASRITLEITEVRVQRLQAISEEDAAAEGVSSPMPFKWRKDEWQNETPNIARFAALWESINGAASWAANPWVWAITFKMI